MIGLLPINANILLVYGEIDCRAHLGKQVDIQKRSVEDIIEECVSRYFSVVLEIKKQGYNIGLWGAIPQTNFSAYAPSHPFPSYGDDRQRNNITRVFNNYLSKECSSHGVIFVNIFEDLINFDLTPKLEFFMDPNHLSLRALPLALSKIKKAYKMF